MTVVMENGVMHDKIPVLQEEDEDEGHANKLYSCRGDDHSTYVSKDCDLDTSSTCIPLPRSASGVSDWGLSPSDLEDRLRLTPRSNLVAPRLRSVNSPYDHGDGGSQCIRTDIDNESILQAVVFIEDAYNYRSIEHKVTTKTLQFYRVYISRSTNAMRMCVITLLHLLAFVEYPSSLSVSSDPRYSDGRISLPCWLTQSTEFLCLLLLTIDNAIRMHLMGFHYFAKHKWHLISLIVLIFSLVDWTVSFSMGCHEFIRFRRILRPYFIMQNSSLMKKIVRCLRMTMPEVMSVLLLLFFHLYIFTLVGMLLFPELARHTHGSNGTITPINDDEGSEYFGSLLDSFISLLVLLTTANNPDVTLPAYSSNRLASIFFILYLIIGLYFFMNILLAVIYNQFRGYFLSSMQSSLIRRRLAVRAAYAVLQSQIPNGQTYVSEMQIGMGPLLMKSIIEQCQLPKYVKSALSEELDCPGSNIYTASDFQSLMSAMDRDIIHKQKVAVRWFSNPHLRKIQRVILHSYFSYFGVFVAACNLLAISVGLAMNNDTSIQASIFRVFNFLFVAYYFLEQLLKLWANGFHRYVTDSGSMFDAVVTLALMAGEIATTALHGSPFSTDDEVKNNTVLWNIIRMVNILIMVRMFKMIPYIKSMNLVASVLLDLIKNMRAFLGISVVCFYAFAILGIELFHGKIDYNPSFKNKTFPCGSYEQLEYWANNFDDFFAAVVVLWDVMVVNNWQVFLYIFKRKTTPWSYLYFIAWWLVSVIVVMNLFTALIMENFIMKWDRRDQIGSHTYESVTVPVHINTVHSMFRDLLQEPEEDELVDALKQHHYLRLRDGELEDSQAIVS